MKGRPVTVEIVGCSVPDCIAIERAGADRIELCSALSEGGLTPSFGLLHEARSACGLPMMAMVRPRSGGFYYSESEFAQIKSDAEALAEWGASGLVFGILKVDGTIDVPRMAEIARIAPKRDLVCHRAFDVTPDPFGALEALIDLGMTRILTSGHRKAATEAIDHYRQLLHRADNRIEIIAGGGLRPHNVRGFVSATGVRQVHLAPLKSTLDPTSNLGTEITYGSHTEIDAEQVAEVVRNLSAL